MKLQKKRKPYKKCPRCGNLCLESQTRCEECDLLFSRLEYASNKAAKKKLLHFDRDYVLYTNKLPKDVKYWKLLLLTIFTGIFGGQYYYVGKFFKGMLMSATFVLAVFCTIFNAQMIDKIEGLYLYVPIGIATFSWMVSISYVVLRKFKVPMIVDIPQSVQDDMKKQREEFESLKNEVEKENKKLQKKARKDDVPNGKNENEISGTDAANKKEIDEHEQSMLANKSKTKSTQGKKRGKK